MQSQGGYERTFLLGQCMVKGNRSNSKIRLSIPIAGRPLSLEDMVNILRENGVEVDMEDHLGYRKHLVERYQSNPQFDLKDFFSSNENL